MAFQKVEKQPAGKPDARGKVRVKVILQDPRLAPGYPVSGNLKYEVELENATVGEVQAAIEAVLFNDGK